MSKVFDATEWVSKSPLTIRIRVHGKLSHQVAVVWG